MGFLDNLLKVNSVLITLGFGSIIGIVVQILKSVKNFRVDAEKSRQKVKEATEKEREKTEKRFENLEYANVAMLHDKIYKQCTDFLRQGWISVDDLENLDYLWRGYRGLGGNGTGEVLYKKVQNLPNLEIKKEGV